MPIQWKDFNMRDSISALYKLADRYQVPRSEIESWLKEHTGICHSTYAISSYDLELFKGLKDLEEIHLKNSKSLLSQSIPVEKLESRDSQGKTVTLTVRVLL